MSAVFVRQNHKYLLAPDPMNNYIHYKRAKR